MTAITRENQPPLGTFSTEAERKVPSMVPNMTKNTMGTKTFLRHTVSMTKVRKNVVTRKSQLTARPYARPMRALVRKVATTISVSAMRTCSKNA